MKKLLLGLSLVFLSLTLVAKPITPVIKKCYELTSQFRDSLKIAGDTIHLNDNITYNKKYKSYLIIGTSKKWDKDNIKVTRDSEYYFYIDPKNNKLVRVDVISIIND